MGSVLVIIALQGQLNQTGAVPAIVRQLNVLLVLQPQRNTPLTGVMLVGETFLAETVVTTLPYCRESLLSSNTPATSPFLLVIGL
jgi:hypothetical protein